MTFSAKDLKFFVVAPGVSKYIDANRPKVAIIAPSLDTVPSRGGHAIYSLIEDIAYHSCYPILIFSVYGIDLISSKVSNQIIYYKKPLARNCLQKIMGYRLRKFIYGVSRVEDFQYMIDVLQLCYSLNIKCLVAEDSNSLLPKLPLIFKRGLKTILHQHATAPFSINKWHWKIFQKKIDEIVFVAQSSQKRIESKHGKLRVNTKVIYNGVDLAKYQHNTDSEDLPSFKLKYDSDVKILLYVGRIIKEKGVMELCEAVTTLKSKTALMVVGEVGSDQFSKELQKVAESNPEKIHLAGLVTQECIASYYQIADFVIIPSVGDEGLPKVATEALVMGKPIIASNRGGIWELVDLSMNGIKIEDPIDKNSIADAIDRGLKSENSLKQSALAKREYYRSILSAERMAKEFDQIFERYL